MLSSLFFIAAVAAAGANALITHRPSRTRRRVVGVSQTSLADSAA